jgi:regulator of replication initiation timing
MARVVRETDEYVLLVTEESGTAEIGSARRVFDSFNRAGGGNPVKFKGYRRSRGKTRIGHYAIVEAETVDNLVAMLTEPPHGAPPASQIIGRVPLSSIDSLAAINLTLSDQLREAETLIEGSDAVLKEALRTGSQAHDLSHQIILEVAGLPGLESIIDLLDTEEQGKIPTVIQEVVSGLISPKPPSQNTPAPEPVLPDFSGFRVDLRYEFDSPEAAGEWTRSMLEWKTSPQPLQRERGRDGRRGRQRSLSDDERDRRITERAGTTFEPSESYVNVTIVEPLQLEWFSRAASFAVREVTRSGGSLVSLTSRPYVSVSSSPDLSDRVTELEETLGGVKTDLSSVTEDRNRLQDLYDNCERRIGELEVEIVSLEAGITTGNQIENERNRLRGVVASLEPNLEAATRKLGELEGVEARNVRELDYLADEAIKVVVLDRRISLAEKIMLAGGTSLDQALATRELDEQGLLHEYLDSSDRIMALGGIEAIEASITGPLEQTEGYLAIEASLVDARQKLEEFKPLEGLFSDDGKAIDPNAIKEKFGVSARIMEIAYTAARTEADEAKSVLEEETTLRVEYEELSSLAQEIKVARARIAGDKATMQQLDGYLQGLRHVNLDFEVLGTRGHTYEVAVTLPIYEENSGSALLRAIQVAALSPILDEGIVSTPENRRGYLGFRLQIPMDSDASATGLLETLVELGNKMTLPFTQTPGLRKYSQLGIKLGYRLVGSLTGLVDLEKGEERIQVGAVIISQDKLQRVLALQREGFSTSALLSDESKRLAEEIELLSQLTDRHVPALPAVKGEPTAPTSQVLTGPIRARTISNELYQKLAEQHAILAQRLGINLLALEDFSGVTRPHSRTMYQTAANELLLIMAETGLVRSRMLSQNMRSFLVDSFGFSEESVGTRTFPQLCADLMQDFYTRMPGERIFTRPETLTGQNSAYTFSDSVLVSRDQSTSTEPEFTFPYSSDKPVGWHRSALGVGYRLLNLGGRLQTKVLPMSVALAETDLTSVEGNRDALLDHYMLQEVLGSGVTISQVLPGANDKIQDASANRLASVGINLDEIAESRDPVSITGLEVYTNVR